MAKKQYKHREQHLRARKGPAPRPVRKPAPPSLWQRLWGNRPLFFGLAALAVVLLVALAFGGPRLVAALKRPAASPTPAEPGAPSGQRSWPSPPAMAIDPAKTYTATIVTDKGDITIELLAAQAPQTVNNFVFLARQGYYDGVTFHRVLEGFMAQGGDPTGRGGGGPGYEFADEITPELTFDGPGIVAMANSGPNTNGSQFFITYAATTHLNGKHTIFGRVTAGMDVAEQLTLRDPQKNPNAPPGDAMRTIRITES